MAPSPLVGINPMMASKAVLTETESEHPFSERSWVGAVQAQDPHLVLNTLMLSVCYKKGKQADTAVYTATHARDTESGGLAWPQSLKMFKFQVQLETLPQKIKRIKTPHNSCWSHTHLHTKVHKHTK